MHAPIFVGEGRVGEGLRVGMATRRQRSKAEQDWGGRERPREKKWGGAGGCHALGGGSEREKWLIKQFEMLTDDLLRAVKQDRLNAGGFSRELHELNLRPPPLTSAMTLATLIPPRRLSPAVLRGFEAGKTGAIGVSGCGSADKNLLGEPGAGDLSSHFVR